MTKKDSQLPGYKLRLLRQQMARRRANLLDPKWGKGETDRRFPQWNPSMSTAEYITRYQYANQNTNGFDPSVGRLQFVHAPGVPSEEVQS
jgi:hypothetical protein